MKLFKTYTKEEEIIFDKHKKHSTPNMELIESTLNKKKHKTKSFS